MVDPELARDISQPRVGRPQRHVRYQGRREKVRIDPSDATAMKPALADELDDLAVRYDGHLIHECIVCEELFAAALVTNQKFTEHEVMAADLALAADG